MPGGRSRGLTPRLGVSWMTRGAGRLPAAVSITSAIIQLLLLLLLLLTEGEYQLLVVVFRARVD